MNVDEATVEAILDDLVARGVVLARGTRLSLAPGFVEALRRSDAPLLELRVASAAATLGIDLAGPDAPARRLVLLRLAREALR